VGDVEPPPSPPLLVVGGGDSDVVGIGGIGGLGVVGIEDVGLIGGELVGNELVGIVVGVPTVDVEMSVLVVEMTGVGEEGPMLLVVMVVMLAIVSSRQTCGV
jgi:hypothetical protein